MARSKHGVSHPSWKRKAIHYTFIVQGNKILEMGMNRPNAYPPIHYGYPEHAYIHSEVDAWKKARGLLTDAGWEIVNIKLTKGGAVLSDAAPCENCLNFLVGQGCKHFYFTTRSGMAKLIT